MCVNDVCVINWYVDWMQNGWMETGLSGCGEWIESGSEEWRGSGSHTCSAVKIGASEVLTFSDTGSTSRSISCIVGWPVARLYSGQFDPKFQVEEVAPPIIFERLVRPINALQNFAADSLQTKKLCSRLSSSEERLFYGNRLFCVFWDPLWGTLEQHTTIILGSLESS